MNPEDDKNIERAAYHESGHIAITYLSGYSCQSVELLASDPGTGKTSMDYTNDLMLIASITNSKTDPDFFNGLSKEVKSQSPGVAHRITTILLAGSASESIHVNGGLVNGDMPVEISGPDLDRVENVHYFLSQIKKNHDQNYIQKTLHSILMMMSIPEVWKGIDILAKALLKKDTKQLNKIEIETILKTSGYFDFIKKL